MQGFQASTAEILSGAGQEAKRRTLARGMRSAGRPRSLHGRVPGRIHSIHCSQCDSLARGQRDLLSIHIVLGGSPPAVGQLVGLRGAADDDLAHWLARTWSPFGAALACQQTW